MFTSWTVRPLRRDELRMENERQREENLFGRVNSFIYQVSFTTVIRTTCDCSIRELNVFKLNPLGKLTNMSILYL